MERRDPATVEMPTGCAIFPRENDAPLEWARVLSKVTHTLLATVH